MASHVILSSLTDETTLERLFCMWLLAAQVLNPGCEWPVWDAPHHTSHQHSLLAPLQRCKAQNVAYDSKEEFEFFLTDE